VHVQACNWIARPLHFPTTSDRLLNYGKLICLRETYNEKCPPRNVKQMSLGQILALINIHAVWLEFNFLATDYSIISNELKGVNAVDGRNTYEL